MYPGAYHNLVLDLVKEEVLRDIVTWIEQRTPA
jgi:alpha-beta hydrolase superfamily lysophospholipase